MIDVVLGNEGIKKLQRELKKKKTFLERIINMIEQAIAMKGEELLAMNAPTEDVDGNIPGRIDTEQRNNGWAVSYIGQDVAFIEFGTGYVGQNNPYPDAVAMARVQWAYDVNYHGQEGWFYYSKRDGILRHSRGMRPEKPVYDTVAELQGLVQGIAERILHEKFSE